MYPENWALQHLEQEHDRDEQQDLTIKLEEILMKFFKHQSTCQKGREGSLIRGRHYWQPETGLGNDQADACHQNNIGGC